MPESVAEPVAAELALIDGAAGIALSPVMNLGSTAADGVMEDYTQYIPRSYYAGNETLERYFKAMMYYGPADLPRGRHRRDPQRAAALPGAAAGRRGRPIGIASTP